MGGGGGGGRKKKKKEAVEAGSAIMIISLSDRFSMLLLSVLSDLS